MTEEERRNALFRGQAVPIFELLGIAKARKDKGLEAVPIDNQSVIREARTDAAIVRKLDQMARICSNTIMNVDEE